MYIRVKRMKATYFIQCDPIWTVLDVKQKLFTLTEQPVTNQRLVLMSTEEVLEDLKSLTEQKVENDAAVTLTLRKDANEFEKYSIRTQGGVGKALEVCLSLSLLCVNNASLVVTNNCCK
ncbi:hypothetical protein N665_0198s0253 [Sinapis alba]|nr:hypothetical protein N665_0198s0253 [Sinapis alba]